MVKKYFVDFLFYFKNYKIYIFLNLILNKKLDFLCKKKLERGRSNELKIIFPWFQLRLKYVFTETKMIFMNIQIHILN